MATTGIEIDGPGGGTIVIGTVDGSSILPQVGPGRVFHVAPGCVGVTGAGQPYFDPAGATIGEFASLVYDPQSGRVYAQSSTDPVVRGLMLLRSRPDRQSSVYAQPGSVREPLSASKPFERAHDRRESARAPRTLLSVQAVRPRGEYRPAGARTEPLEATEALGVAHGQREGSRAPQTLLRDTGREERTSRPQTLTQDFGPQAARQDRQLVAVQVDLSAQTQRQVRTPHVDVENFVRLDRARQQRWEAQ